MVRLRCRRDSVVSNAAIARGDGDLPVDLDPELALDLLFRPVWMRALVTRSPLEPDLAPWIVEPVLPALGGRLPRQDPAKGDSPCR